MKTNLGREGGGGDSWREDGMIVMRGGERGIRKST